MSDHNPLVKDTTLQTLDEVIAALQFVRTVLGNVEQHHRVCRP